jgi:hypothetical protein
MSQADEDLAQERAREQWQRHSVGNGAKGPRLDDWMRIELSSPEAEGWQRWLVVRQSHFVGVMGIADEHGDARGVAEAHESSGEVTADGGEPTQRVSRSSVMEEGNPCSANVCATAGRRGLCCKIVANMMSHQDRSAFVDDIERFHHMLFFAMWIEPRPAEASLKSRCQCCIGGGRSVGSVKVGRREAMRPFSCKSR